MVNTVSYSHFAKQSVNHSIVVAIYAIFYAVCLFDEDIQTLYICIADSV